MKKIDHSQLSQFGRMAILASLARTSMASNIQIASSGSKLRTALNGQGLPASLFRLCVDARNWIEDEALMEFFTAQIHTFQGKIVGAGDPMLKIMPATMRYHIRRKPAPGTRPEWELPDSNQVVSPPYNEVTLANLLFKGATVVGDFAQNKTLPYLIHPLKGKSDLLDTTQATYLRYKHKRDYNPLQVTGSVTKDGFIIIHVNLVVYTYNLPLEEWIRVVHIIDRLYNHPRVTSRGYYDGYWFVTDQKAVVDLESWTEEDLWYKPIWEAMCVINGHPPDISDEDFARATSHLVCPNRENVRQHAIEFWKTQRVVMMLYRFINGENIIDPNDSLY